ncbi:transporter [Vibrio cholerae]|nr:transporter [Vibrio cholerae]EIF5159825.1 transporter [Vibrio cholerae]EIJ0938052.1 transporter [Vibrio cholerae]EJF1125952.1 transporter [Vibrio cholerae]EJH4015922.1 transporter [Vibrio cholerae]EJI4014597.1 transporter [Vibrio cholerae]
MKKIQIYCVFPHKSVLEHKKAKPIGFASSVAQGLGIT